MSNPESLSVEQVGQLLQDLQLSSLAPAFKENAVNGSDLVGLTDDELMTDLGLTKLQVRKIRGALHDMASSAPAAAAVPTPPAAAATSKAQPANAPKPAFSPADLKAYAGLRGRIAGLEDAQVEAKTAEAKRAANATYAQLTKAQQQLKAAEEVEAEAKKEREACDHWYIGKKLLGEGKRDAKLEEKEHALQEAQKQSAAARDRVSALQAGLAAAKKAADGLQADVDELARARSQQAALVERIFSDPGWGADRTLLDARTAIRDYERQGAEAAGHSATYDRSGGLLRGAAGKIEQGMQLLQRTRMMGAMEMGMDFASPMRRPGGSMMMDMAEMMQVRRANDLVQAAAQDVAAARQVLPTLPWVNEGVLKAARAGVFASMLAPGLGGNLMQQAMIRKSMESVRQMQGEVAQCLSWVQSNAATAHARASQLQASAAAKKNEMAAYELRQLDAALKAAQ